MKSGHKRQILGPVIVPIMAAGLLVQAAVPLARIQTTYATLDLGLGAQAIAFLPAAFAILPVFLTVALGRINDRGGARITVLAGGLSILVATAMLMLMPPSFAMLLLGTSILGIGQTLVLAALQLMISRSSSVAHRDAMLGNYMVAISLGQAIGPLFVGGTGGRFVIPFIGAALLMVAVLVLFRLAPKKRRAAVGTPIPLSHIASTRGLPWLIVIGSICVASQDLVLAFLPVLGSERGIEPATIGLLLTLRAIAAVVSRIFFSHAVARFGRMRVMLGASAIGGLGLLILGLPLPLWGLAVAMITTGFGVGIALTSTVALTLVVAPPAASGTALSLRLTANRIAQFTIPLGAGVVVGPFGAAGVLAVSGAVLLAITTLRPTALVKDI